VHASGHAASEELRFLLEVVRPKYFIPVHGEARHLAAHAELAHAVGMAPEAVAVIDNGTVAEISESELRVSGSVSVGAVPIDAEGQALRAGEARESSSGDLVVVSVTMDRSSRKLVAGPETVVVGEASAGDRRLVDEGREVLRQTLQHRRDLRGAGELRRMVGAAMEGHLAGAGAWRPRVVAIVSLT
jgi:ribonuclease J